MTTHHSVNIGEAIWNMLIDEGLIGEEERIIKKGEKIKVDRGSTVGVNSGIMLLKRDEDNNYRLAARIKSVKYCSRADCYNNSSSIEHGSSKSCGDCGATFCSFDCFRKDWKSTEHKKMCYTTAYFYQRETYISRQIKKLSKNGHRLKKNFVIRCFRKFRESPRGMELYKKIQLAYTELNMSEEEVKCYTNKVSFLHGTEI